MQVRLERTDGLVIGVRDEVTLHRLLAGDLADAGHRNAPEIRKAADYTGFLEQSAFCERDREVAGDDEVIEDLHLDERESARQVPREELIRAARLRDPRRMVVRESRPGRQCVSTAFRLELDDGRFTEGKARSA